MCSSLKDNKFTGLTLDLKIWFHRCLIKRFILRKGETSSPDPPSGEGVCPKELMIYQVTHNMKLLANRSGAGVRSQDFTIIKRLMIGSPLPIREDSWFDKLTMNSVR
jgi:hypothetical protein